MYSVSVAIPNYNGESLLNDNITSVYEALKYSKIENYEIIVSDDASTDGSIPLLEKDFPEVIILKNSRNRGFSSNINNAIFRATKDLTLLLNTDVTLNKNSLTPLFKHFEKDDTFGATGILLNDTETKSVSNAVFPLTPLSLVLKIKEYKHLQKDSYYTFFLCGGLALIDRKKLHFLKGFDELFNPYYSEDVDLGLRAWRCGYKSYFDAHSFAKHALTTTIKKEKSSRVRWSIKKNKLFLYYLHHSSLTFWTYIISIAIGKAGLKFLILKPEYIRAILSLLKTLPELRKRKKKNQHLYKTSIREIVSFFNKNVDNNRVFILEKDFYTGIIEKNIIQTWKTKQVPIYLKKFSNTWKNQYNFNYLLFNDAQMEGFVKQQYPLFYKTFLTLKPVEKTDVFRIMAIYEYGGVYTDLDTSCECNLDSLLNKFREYSFLVGEEIKTTDYLQITNWTFIAKKHHPALKRIIENMCTHIQKNPTMKTLEKTGPVIFTELVLNEIKTDKTIKILPIEYFGAGQKHSDSPPKKNGYIIHHFMGSWKKHISWSKKFRFFFFGVFGKH